MKYACYIVFAAISLLQAQYSTTKYDTLFIKSSASFYNHQHFVESAKKEIIEIGEDIVPFLVSNCSSRQPREYHALRDLFSKIDCKLSSRYLMDEIKKMDKNSFSTAVEFLGLSKYERGLEFLEPFLSIDSAWVKISTLRGIGDLNDPRSVKVVKPFKNDPDYKLRWQSATVLGKMNTLEGDRELVSMLNDSLQLVSHTALHYLNSHLKVDSLKERVKVIDRKMDSALLDLLKRKYIENKETDLISERKIETTVQDTLKEFTIPDLVSDKSVIYTALKELYMDKRSFFLPVKSDKELFLFPSIAKMFADPMLQVSLPNEVKNNYTKFPEIDFKEISYEFNSNLPDSAKGKIDIDSFVKLQKDIAENFDLMWSGYSYKNKIVDVFFERILKDDEDTPEEDTGTDEVTAMIRNRLDERRYYDDSQKFYKETLKDIQPKFIVESGIRSYSDFLALIAYVKNNKLESSINDSPFGKIVIGSEGDDIYEGSYFLIIDKGGNDVYKLDNKHQRFSYIIDLSGNDRYTSDEFGPASAYNGISFLYDGNGDDVYDCKDFSLASSLFGFSVLLDENGNDKYLSLKHSQSAATFGYSCLWDKSGNDVYLGEMKTQAYAGVLGYSVLSDDNGNDNYTLSGNQVDVLRYADHFISMGQGYSFGDRDHACGGLAFLLDKQGNDNYISDIFGQGGGYWFAFGALVDMKGNDNYISYQYSMGSGVHLAFGTLIDYEGDDSYKSKGVSLGCGHDYAGGMFFDLKGNDSYQAESLSIGSGNADAISIFYDGQGDDLYSAHQANTMGWSDWRRDAGYISIFIDMNGNDKYGTLFGANNQRWYQSTWGVGLDFDFKIKK
ncbi:MAG: HEAT repeat domain-containing protein [Candidatus Delongbacteria bacterium]|nr:HEAT repeat domain-containing protein [Candidatus Delongbacteria bacterium]